MLILAQFADARFQALVVRARHRQRRAFFVAGFAHAVAVGVVVTLLVFAKLAVAVLLLRKLAQTQRFDARLRLISSANRRAIRWRWRRWCVVHTAVARLLADTRRVVAVVARNRRVPERVTAAIAWRFHARVAHADLRFTVVERVAFQRVVARFRRRVWVLFALYVGVTLAYTRTRRVAVVVGTFAFVFAVVIVFVVIAAATLLAAECAVTAFAAIRHANRTHIVPRLRAVDRRGGARRWALGAAGAADVCKTERRAARFVALLAARCDTARKSLDICGEKTCI